MEKDDSEKSVEELLDEYTTLMDATRLEDAVRMREIMAELEKRGVRKNSGTKRRGPPATGCRSAVGSLPPCSALPVDQVQCELVE